MAPEENPVIGMVHFFVVFLNARYISLVADWSVGKWTRFLIIFCHIWVLDRIGRVDDFAYLIEKQQVKYHPNYIYFQYSPVIACYSF
jgi:hypothetical protein